MEVIERAKTLDTNQTPFVFMKDAKGRTCLSFFGLGDDRFHIQLADSAERLPLPEEAIDTSEKRTALAETLFRAAYGAGYFERNGMPRDDQPKQNSGIVERLRPAFPQTLFSADVKIGPIADRSNLTHTVWARRLTA